MQTNATTARFVSRYREFRIVMKASYNKEVDGRSVYVPGHSIEFKDNQYVTSDEQEIEFLMARPEMQTGILVRVPDNIKDPNEVITQMNKTLEDKDAEIARLKAQNEALSAKQGVSIDPEAVAPNAPQGTPANAEGATVSTPYLEGETNPYAGMAIKALVEECRKREIPANKNDGGYRLLEKLRLDDIAKGTHQVTQAY